MHAENAGYPSCAKKSGLPPNTFLYVPQNKSNVTFAKKSDAIVKYTYRTFNKPRCNKETTPIAEDRHHPLSELEQWHSTQYRIILLKLFDQEICSRHHEKRYWEQLRAVNKYYSNLRQDWTSHLSVVYSTMGRESSRISYSPSS